MNLWIFLKDVVFPIGRYFPRGFATSAIPHINPLQPLLEPLFLLILKFSKDVYKRQMLYATREGENPFPPKMCPGILNAFAERTNRPLRYLSAEWEKTCSKRQGNLISCLLYTSKDNLEIRGKSRFLAARIFAGQCGRHGDSRRI